MHVPELRRVQGNENCNANLDKLISYNFVASVAFSFVNPNWLLMHICSVHEHHKFTMNTRIDVTARQNLWAGLFNPEVTRERKDCCLKKYRNMNHKINFIPFSLKLCKNNSLKEHKRCEHFNLFCSVIQA